MKRFIYGRPTVHLTLDMLLNRCHVDVGIRRSYWCAHGSAKHLVVKLDIELIVAVLHDKL